MTFALALICTVCSMAQTGYITHNVMWNNQKSMECKLVWQSGQGGNYRLAVVFTDEEGYFIEAQDSRYSDTNGYFCFFSTDMVAANYSTVTSTCWIPNSVLSQHLERGRTYLAYLSIYSNGNEIVSINPMSFSMN